MEITIVIGLAPNPFRINDTAHLINNRIFQIFIVCICYRVALKILTVCWYSLTICQCHYYLDLRPTLIGYIRIVSCITCGFYQLFGTSVHRQLDMIHAVALISDKTFTITNTICSCFIPLDFISFRQLRIFRYICTFSSFVLFIIVFVLICFYIQIFCFPKRKETIPLIIILNVLCFTVIKIRIRIMRSPSVI